MLRADYTSAFRKDLKRAIKSGKDIPKLKTIMAMLVEEIPLDVRQRDHALRGNFKDYRECHIEPDWLLIYKVEGQEIIFTRIGSHSQLFG